MNIDNVFDRLADIITLPYKIIITLCVACLYCVIFVIFLPITIPYGIFWLIKKMYLYISKRGEE